MQEHHLDWLFGVAIPYANFVVFLAMLFFFFGKKLKSMAETRRSKFEVAANDAANKLKLANDALLSIQAKQLSLKEELDRFITQSDRMTKNEIESIERDTKKALEQIQVESKKLGEEEFVRAKQALRLEMVEKARELAKTQVERFTSDEMKRVFARKVEQLDAKALP